MTLRFTDGFDYYSSADLLKKWDAANSTATGLIAGENARPGSLGMGFRAVAPGNASPALKKTLDDQATWYIGMAFQILIMPGAVTLIRFDDSAGNEQCSLRVDASNHLVMTRNGTVIGSAASGTLSAATWYYVEVKVTIHNTTGAIEVRLDGSTVIGPTGSLNTRAQTENSARSISFWPANNANFRCDDIYMCDSSGSSNNTFLGPVVVNAIHPEGAGNKSQWGSVGYTDNWRNVADTMADGDVTFNQDSTAGHIDTYVGQDIQSGTVLGIQWNAWVRKDAGAARSVAPVLRISGTDYVGTTQTVPGSYVNMMQCYDVSPATSSAFTASELNGAEFGIKLIS